MEAFEERLHAELQQLAAEGNLRHLDDLVLQGKYIVYKGKKYLNLSSNDYLGLTAGGACEEASWQEGFYLNNLQNHDWVRGECLMSNPSSRLITGNSIHYARLESALAEFFGGGVAALTLSSGFMANAGVLPALTRRGELVLADKLSHASLIDGLRLGPAEWKRFRHNDMEHLETLLQKAQTEGYGTVWVATESIFSMDGDIAPMADLVALKNKYGFKLYLDEAHAFGVAGPGGRGIAAQAGVEEHCDVRIATFGKALASAGAFVLCKPLVREYLINKMRTLIFSTALPPVTLMWSAYMLQKLPSLHGARKHLRAMTALLAEELGVRAASHIIPLPAGSNERALDMARQGREQGYWLTAIRSPTVPKGAARIRLSLTAALTEEDVLEFARACKRIG